MFKKGSTVRQIVPVIEGKVSSTRFNEEQQQLEYHVDYKDAGGHPHSRWFFENQLEAKPTDGETQTLSSDDVGSAAHVLKKGK